MDVADATNLENGQVHNGNRIIACMPVDRYASHYNMDHPNRGMALIFNHEFAKTSEPRTGTNVDCEELVSTLENLDFDVRVHKDLILRDIQKELKIVAEMDHSNNDCICITILTHGTSNGLYAEDYIYELDAILSYFTANRCPSLAGKPKIFFIQACRGRQTDAGVSLAKHIETDSAGSCFRIPAHADFLIAYSTISGFCAWRDNEYGTWFIQSLCRELNQHGKKHDILTLLTFVSQRVAYDFETFNSKKPEFHQKKQIPCVTSMLTRLLSFTENKRTTVNSS